MDILAGGLDVGEVPDGRAYLDEAVLGGFGCD